MSKKIKNTEVKTEKTHKKKGAGMRGSWFNALLRRRAAVALLIVAQLALFIWFLVSRSRSSVYTNMALRVLSLIVVFIVVLRRTKSAFKLSWVILILTFPVFGGLFYLLSNFQSSTFIYRKRLKDIEATLMHPALEGRGCYDEAAAALPGHITQIRYLEKFAGFPIWNKTDTEFLTPGEKYHERLLDELKKAEKYIFMEYFIVEEGKMWDSILDVLKQKAAEGVEVRMMYDDIGCFFLLPQNYRAREI